MSDTGRPGPDPAHHSGRPSWGQTGQTPPVAPATPPPVTSWQAATPTAVTPAAPAAVPPATGGEPPAGESKRRPGWLVPAIIGVVVLVVAAVIIGIVSSNKGSDAAAPPAVASTILLPSPTPTIDPVARTATTAFATALPTSLLQYALASSADNPTWTAGGAIEAYTETYTDGGSGTVTVNAGQWETPAEATAFAATLTAALPAAPSPAPTATAAASSLPQSGDVTAAGAPVGTYTIADAGGGNGVAVWTNGTTVFQLTGPVADIVNLYAAYPL
ncbi:hypothetical protein ACPPVS_01215 [Cellulomonas sp. McL0617]|uniref:hypothetical protein n=1 Tax=Cellulomonas sp. McL0617 TaxID=3415675 RepID=UPI003CEE920B